MDALPRKQLPNLSANEREASIDRHMHGFKDEVTADRIQPGKRDAFAVGMTGLKALHGLPRFDLAHHFYNQFKVDPDFKVAADPSSNSVGQISSAQSKELLLGELINDMTTLDIGKRRGIEEGLNHDAFKPPGVGTPETRGVIKTKAANEAAAKQAAAQEVASSPAFTGEPQPPGPRRLRPAMHMGIAEQLQAQLDDARRYVTR